MDTRRILILGGTAQARDLAQRLAPRRDLAVTLSLAGRTSSPAAQAVPVRIGGFGGVDGLADYLARTRVDALIDATHPYAARISANAAQAAERTRIPILVLLRPPWAPLTGDRWTEAADTVHAVRALGTLPRRVFVALGRNELAPLAGAPQHYYLVRSIDPVDPPLPVPRADYITARGPFAEADERALLLDRRIEIVLAKNSGGSASYGKIAVARALGLPVILLRRPVLPDLPAVESIEEVLDWLDHAPTFSATRGV